MLIKLITFGTNSVCQSDSLLNPCENPAFQHDFVHYNFHNDFERPAAWWLVWARQHFATIVWWVSPTWLLSWLNISFFWIQLKYNIYGLPQPFSWERGMTFNKCLISSSQLWILCKWAFLWLQELPQSHSSAPQSGATGLEVRLCIMWAMGAKKQVLLTISYWWTACWQCDNWSVIKSPSIPHNLTFMSLQKLPRSLLSTCTRLYPEHQFPMKGSDGWNEFLGLTPALKMVNAFIHKATTIIGLFVLVGNTQTKQVSSS